MKKICFANKDCQVIKDKVIKPVMFGSDINEFETPHTRPDIVLIDHENRSVL